MDAVLRRNELLQAGELTLSDHPHSLFEGDAGALVLLHRYYLLSEQDDDATLRRPPLHAVEEGGIPFFSDC